MKAEREKIVEAAAAILVSVMFNVFFAPALSETFHVADNSLTCAFLSALAIFLVYLSFLCWHLLRQVRESKNGGIGLRTRKERYDTVRIYAASSRYWADMFEGKGTAIHVRKCTVLIRAFIAELTGSPLYTRDGYEKQVQEAIAVWKGLRQQGIIERLVIYEYAHIPDHYYGIFDKDELMTGLQIFSETDSTGQYGNRDTRIVYGDSPDHQRQIDLYIKQFDNYTRFYQDKKVYDSAEH